MVIDVHSKMSDRRCFRTSLMLGLVLAVVFRGRLVAAGGNYQECSNKLAQSLQYCNMSLSMEDRVESLLGELNLTEKLGLLSPNATWHDSCYSITSAVSRLGIGRYMWLTEVNSQANSICQSDGRCATAFSGALGLAASFNTSVWYLKGDVISTELRAAYNSGVTRIANYSFVGLSGFGPNINIARDPRFGRTSELPGEDPFLNGQYAIQYIRGMQQVDDKGHFKMLALLKHYTAYSTETNRGHDNYNISMHMLFDTYLPAYEMAFKQGRASGVMCSYTGINGAPSCANDFILNKIMRDKWRQPNALVMTDCGAVSNILGAPLNAPSPAYAVAWALGNGTDIEAGDVYFSLNGEEAVSTGLLEVSVVDNAVRRVLRQMMRVGRFDFPYEGKVSWSSIKAETRGSPDHVRVRHDAARQSAVLLRNLGSALPLNPRNEKVIVVVGALSSSKDGLLPDYFGDEVCPSGGTDCMSSFYEAIKSIHAGPTLSFQGVTEQSTDPQTDTYIKAVDAVKNVADIVVLVLGISKATEHEGVDRQQTSLPGLQSQFALDVLKVAKDRNIPAIVILVNGGALSIDEMMPKRTYTSNIPACYQSRAGVPHDQLPNHYAVVETYNPSFGAPAIVEALFGIGPVSWGRMVTTMYPKIFTETHSPIQYDLSSGDGLTYRYHTGDVLATFGEGMPHEEPSMATLGCKMQSAIHTRSAMKKSLEKTIGTLQCVASNLSGDRPQSVLIMMYARASEKMRATTTYPIPLRVLRGFERIMVEPEQSQTIMMNITVKDIMLVNKQGHLEANDQRHFDLIDVWDGWDSLHSFPLTLPEEHLSQGFTVESY